MKKQIDRMYDMIYVDEFSDDNEDIKPDKVEEKGGGGGVGYFIGTIIESIRTKLGI